MQNKNELIHAVRLEFDRWTKILSRVDTSLREIPLTPSSLSIKDVLVHLKTWQEITLARLQAALRGGEPVIPAWPMILDHDSEEDLNAINAWIFDSGKGKSYPEARNEWMTGFQHFIELTNEVEEDSVFIPGKYAWLPDYPLSAVIEWSLEHHREHREPVETWLKGQHPE
jgi:hypothetical protein